MPQFTAESTFQVGIEALFRYHALPGAIDRLLPPWQNVQIAKKGASIDVGTEVVLRLGTPIGIPIHWHARHTKLEPSRLFEDIQTSGPMASWTHQHRFESVTDETSRLIDDISYRLPLGSVGALLGDRFFRNELTKMFRYRHATTRDDLELIHRLPQRKLRIAVSGASGLVGSNLVALLQVAGHEVLKLSRGKSASPISGSKESGVLAWSPSEGLADPAAAEGLDAVVHLAGKSIGDQRWTDSVKQMIRDSRVKATAILAKQLAQLNQPPKAFISCSAIGYYGDRGDEMLDETSAKGTGFLSDVCAGWEEATEPLQESGRTRVVHTRLGIVLHPRQAAMAKLLTPIWFGAGGPMGTGRQYWSWISISDCIGALYQLCLDDRATGIFNLVAPHPERNRDFVRKIARIVHRPSFFPTPKFALRLALGEMADPLLFDSCRVQPVKLEGLGYSFRHPTLESAIRYLLGL
ncbi:MAG: TIGR01777 family oxidoreductase [Planctomycetes bacterium]|nr:TIGR01777 family oxidoreductase [Planctomycetota bacterium]